MRVSGRNGMKRSRRVDRQIKERIKTLREEVNKLPEYVLQEIQSHPTELEQAYMVPADMGDLKEHEMTIRW